MLFTSHGTIAFVTAFYFHWTECGSTFKCTFFRWSREPKWALDNLIIFEKYGLSLCCSISWVLQNIILNIKSTFLLLHNLKYKCKYNILRINLLFKNCCIIVYFLGWKHTNSTAKKDPKNRHLNFSYIRLLVVFDYILVIK